MYRFAQSRRRSQRSPNPTPWFGHPLFLTLLGLVLGALAMRSLAKWMQMPSLRARKTVSEPWPLGEIAVLAGIDVAAWCVYWLVCRHVSGALFSDRNIVSTVGT